MIEEIEKAIAEVQQPRSRFQIERFVLGQHPTKEMAYFQTLLELQSLLQNQKLVAIDLRIMEIKIARLRESGDEIDSLEADKLELGLDQMRLGQIGQEREIAHLTEIFASFPKRFTRDEIEAAQPDYWKARLTANAEAMLLGQGSVTPSYIEAMAQAGALDAFVKDKLGIDAPVTLAVPE